MPEAASDTGVLEASESRLSHALLPLTDDLSIAWTEPAPESLEAVVSYIASHNPQAAAPSDTCLPGGRENCTSARRVLVYTHSVRVNAFG
jgi:hypothetical protein